MKKIGFLLINQYGGRGGVEKVLVDTFNGLNKRDITPYLLYTHAPKKDGFLESIENKIHIEIPEIYPFLKNKIPKFIYRCLIKTNKNKYIQNFIDKNIIDLDAIIIINFPTNLRSIQKTIIKNSLKLQIPLISWLHGSVQNASSRQIRKINKIIPIFHSHIAISKGIQKELIDCFNANNITLLHNPVGPADITYRNKNKFIYIGGIDDNKRVEELLQILQNVSGKWHLSIFGSTGSNNGDILFQKFIESLGFKEKVTFNGWHPDPWSQIKEAGILLLNSKSEGFPLVLVEAMMRGIPCIASNCPTGPNEIIIHGKNGWLYDVTDTVTPAKIMQSIIDGKTLLPPPLDIQASVKKFSSDIYMENFISHINNSIKIVDKQ